MVSVFRLSKNILSNRKGHALSQYIEYSALSDNIDERLECVGLRRSADVTYSARRKRNGEGVIVGFLFGLDPFSSIEGGLCIQNTTEIGFTAGSCSLLGTFYFYLSLP